jgi:hypothetical protein
LIADGRECPRNASLEENVLKAITELILHGQFEDDFVRNKAIPYLSSSLRFGAHIYPAVEEAMSAVLSRYRIYFETFVKNTLGELQSDTLFFFKAIVRNISKEFKDWLPVYPPARMYVTIHPTIHPFQISINLINLR